MEKRLKTLYQELEILLNYAPCMDDCTEEENEVYSDMANLKNSLFNAGLYQDDCNCENKDPENRFKGLKPGDLVFCMAEGSYSGLLFMAVCNDYVLVCPEAWETEFDDQLEMMSDERIFGLSTGICLYSVKDVFLSEEEAEHYLQTEAE